MAEAKKDDAPQAKKSEAQTNRNETINA